MARTSPCTISLSSTEAAELQRRAAKYTLPYFQVQRAKMILFAAEGLPNDEIAARLDTRREVVAAIQLLDGKQELLPPRRHDNGPL